MKDFKTVDHIFMPTHTVSAVIKKYNGYNLNPRTVDELVILFHTINNEPIPKVGKRYKIPVIDTKHQ